MSCRKIMIMLAVFMTAFCVYGATTNTVTLTIIYPEITDPRAIGPLNINFSNIVAWATSMTNTTEGLQVQISSNDTDIAANATAIGLNSSTGATAIANAATAQATADAALPTATGGSVTGGVTVVAGEVNATSSTYDSYYTEESDGNFGVGINLYQDSASPAAGDAVAFINGVGNDDGANETDYVKMFFRISNPTNGSEAGKWTIDCMLNGSERAFIEVDGFAGGDGEGAVTVNSSNRDIDFIVKDDAGAEAFYVNAADGGLHSATIKTGTTQVISGAIAGEIWADNDADFTLKLGQ